jgi:hypothetical protein
VRWQVKAGVQKAISLLPEPQRYNYVLQRRVTRSLPAPDGQLRLHAREALRHVRAYEAHGARPLGEVRAFEYGAGWDLIGPITTWALGVERQLVVDIDALLRWELVDHTLQRLHALHDELEAALGRPLRRAGTDPVRSTDDLRERFGIDYRAPLDAADTGLEARSMDLISSTFVLEHVPAPVIAGIMRESARLLADGGVVTCSVDLQDHYAFQDPSISVYNFLRYSDRTWRLVNSPLHFQNRMRVRDHLALVEQAGLTVVARDVGVPDADQLAALDELPLAPRFAGGYARDELAGSSLHVIAHA